MEYFQTKIFKFKDIYFKNSYLSLISYETQI